ncbi:MAG TPA: hypothetical protein PLS39_11060, partial [Accumulibacter sp.]|nr:hypothetical protein [Accumulibacter sp.]HND80944.1 hypothetical protein [Accumulibacter sp.]HNH25068.1 hypothetical protein [Accumulibacter sp.]HNL14454.1 hypothetical protein [Accumulibacter sp.]HNL77664.1 hypothetical protein [Accumulibacter sp.]
NAPQSQMATNLQKRCCTNSVFRHYLKSSEVSSDIQSVDFINEQTLFIHSHLVVHGAGRTEENLCSFSLSRNRFYPVLFCALSCRTVSEGVDNMLEQAH